MSLLELGCACLDTSLFRTLVDLAAYPGKGEFAFLAGVATWLYGYYRANDKIKRLGYAILIALIATGILTIALKQTLRFARPGFRPGYSFPSGDSATAFALASTAGAVYPAVAPVFYFIASLTAISRLYLRVHYVWDVIGGALIGTACGYGSARYLIPARGSWRRSFLWMALWTPGVILILFALPFFFRVEREIARHKIDTPKPSPSKTELLRIDFGTASARPHLLAGWSVDKVWTDEKTRINWAEGLHASVGITLPEQRDVRMIMRVYPYRGRGFLCQRVRITINDAAAGEVLLERGWLDYQIKVPGGLFRRGDNRIDFAFSYSDDSNWRDVNPERKPLSVAFETLRLTAN